MSQTVVETGPAGGPLVVLVHGAMDRAGGMARLARKLDHRAHVVRYDRRGYGRAVDHPGPFTVPGHVDDLVAVLAGRPAVLVGHSYGGNVVLAVAARHPELVHGVAVFEPPMTWEPWWPSTSGSSEMARRGEGAELSAAAAAQAAESFMIRMVGAERWAALPERTRATRLAEGRALVAELGDLRNEPWRAEQITVPLLVGVSDHARPHHRQATDTIVGRIPHAVLVELEHCHHDAHNGSPAQFAHRLVEPLLDGQLDRP